MRAACAAQSIFGPQWERIMEIGRFVALEEDLGDARFRGADLALGQLSRREHEAASPWSRRGLTEEGRFATTVEALVAASEAQAKGRSPSVRSARLPSREAIQSAVENLCAAMFPRHFGSSEHAPASLRYYVGARLAEAAATFEEQVRRGLALSCEHEVTHSTSCAPCARRAAGIVEALFFDLGRIRELLETDIRAAYEGDPAASYVDETRYCYPGVMAITRHRIAHELFRADVPLVPRIIAQQSHAATGIDIHPGAKIGPSFFIDHGTGVVIGETCEIGKNVRLYQGVTLGARQFPTQDGALQKGLLRHPIVHDDVVIYAGATLLGRITIGAGSIIGGNVWLSSSVPAASRISQAPVRHRAHFGGSGI